MTPVSEAPELLEPELPVPELLLEVELPELLLELDLPEPELLEPLPLELLGDVEVLARDWGPATTARINHCT